MKAMILGSNRSSFNLFSYRDKLASRKDAKAQSIILSFSFFPLRA
jgi:hypothetical protein